MNTTFDFRHCPIGTLVKRSEHQGEPVKIVLNMHNGAWVVSGNKKMIAIPLKEAVIQAIPMLFNETQEEIGKFRKWVKTQNISQDFHYITVDLSGSVTAHEHRPEPAMQIWVSGGITQSLGHYTANPKANWKN